MNSYRKCIQWKSEISRQNIRFNLFVLFFQNHFFSYDFITLSLCVFYHVFIVQTNYTRISDCTGNFIVTEQAEKKTKKVFISAIDYTCFIPLMLFWMDVFTAVFYNF